MKSTHLIASTAALSFFLAAAAAHAATVSGTVTDKTTGKPASGDVVVLVNPMTGMSEVARATTDAHGHYSMQNPSSGPALLRAVHQGAEYFIAAPEGSAPGDIAVYDVAAKAPGVHIEADVLEVESDNGQLKVTERYFIHNLSSPPVTQWSKKSFELVLPPDAVLDGVGAQRPSGLPTTVKMDPDGPKGHFSFNFPIQPDDGDKDTLFEIGYHVPYSSGSYTFKSQLSLPSDNLAVLLPKSMSLAGGAGASFTQVPQDPNVQTYLMRNVQPGKDVAFTVSGTGSIPRDQQGQAPQASDAGGQSGGPAAAGGQPGGGIGTPINTPDPLSKYKWWILGAMALLLAAAAAFFLRKPTDGVAAEPSEAGALAASVARSTAAATYQPPVSAAAKSTALLNALKEELFSLESEKISGTIAPEEYAKQKAALEIVLARALTRE
jgi:hypothetical protein